jgi:hypothetical protein
MKKFKLQTLDEDDFSIDRFKLEIEAERNSELMRKYGSKLVVISAEEKDARRILNIIEAECAETIRSNPEDYGITPPEKNKKITDKVVFAIAQKQPEYIEQFNLWVNLRRKEEDYKNAIDTCKQRGMMIRILTELWLNNYYSKPVIKKDVIKQGSFIKRILNKNNEEDNDF